MKIKEIIVVEGKDDERAVKQAVDAEIIITSGFQISTETFRKIELAMKNKGVIIFTDPDYPGEQIRKRINGRIKGCKNAYLTQSQARKSNDIGIENASAQDISGALKQARCAIETSSPEFTNTDLLTNGLSSGENASKKREMMGRILGIGYANSRQFLSRLNSYAITRKQFTEALTKTEKVLNI